MNGFKSEKTARGRAKSWREDPKNALGKRPREGEDRRNPGSPGTLDSRFRRNDAR